MVIFHFVPVPPMLFHADNDQHFDLDGMRAHARRMVCAASVVRDAGNGDRKAAASLKTGYWPFVGRFEQAIDQRSLPRRPLTEKFGAARMRDTFVGLAREVREMKIEEGSHAAHWRKDAQCLGLDALGDECVPGVQRLIDSAFTDDLPAFFAMLAGTELAAEELSRFLVGSPGFTNLFSRRRWIWGEIHLAPHHDGPSHLDIDIDLARAYSGTSSVAHIEAMIVETIDGFGEAAADIAETLQV
jgi:hypothetical protein